MPLNDADLQSLLGELSELATEASDTARGDLDLMSTRELVQAMNEQDVIVPVAVGRQAEQIANAVDGIVRSFRAGGRLLYVGAGTPGRIGVLDASECPPTFGTDPSLVEGVIAGGPGAIHTAVENAEDDGEAGAEDMRVRGIGPNDTVVGISASGRTPYVLGAIEYARAQGAFTVAVASQVGSTIGSAADVAIEMTVGPEFVSGSTRLKSGTAQKLVLNMLTTISMIQLGKTFRGVMVDLKATNDKLRARSVRTVMELAGVDSSTAVSALQDADDSVKVAITSILGVASAAEARAALEAADGIVRDAIMRLR